MINLTEVILKWIEGDLNLIAERFNWKNWVKDMGIPNMTHEQWLFKMFVLLILSPQTS